jgi:hypothetical protein
MKIKKNTTVVIKLNGEEIETLNNTLEKLNNNKVGFKLPSLNDDENKLLIELQKILNNY